MSEKKARPNLGQAEQAALVAMVQRGDVWSRKSDWVWESAHWTVAVMGKLEVKGLVAPLDAPETWQLTTQGKLLATEMVLPFVQIPPARRAPAPRKGVPVSPRRGNRYAVSPRRRDGR